MSLQTIQSEQAKWAEQNFGVVPSYQPLLGVVEEIGELAHAHLKQLQGIRTTENHEEKAKDAVGDAVIFLMHYCTLRGWDFTDLVETTWRTVKLRDWRADPAQAKTGEG